MKIFKRRTKPSVSERLTLLEEKVAELEKKLAVSKEGAHAVKKNSEPESKAAFPATPPSPGAPTSKNAAAPHPWDWQADYVSRRHLKEAKKDSLPPAESAPSDPAASRRREMQKRLAALSDADLTSLFRLRKLLAEVPTQFQPLVRRYYNLDDPFAFLTQCGQFANLRQCWEGCRDAVHQGVDPGEIAAFLLAVLELYNRAFPNNTAKALLPQQGALHDYTTQDRVGETGSTVMRTLLPGLFQPSGNLAVKSLVKLT